MILKYNDYLKMVEKIREVTDFKPLIGVVLGTGLGSFVDKIDVKASIYYKDIPNLPISTNPAHQGRYEIFLIYQSQQILLIKVDMYLAIIREFLVFLCKAEFIIMKDLT